MCAGASLPLTQGWKTTLLPCPGPSPLRPSGQDTRWLTVRDWNGVGRSSQRLGLLVPVHSDYSLGWQQGIPKPAGMFEVTRGGWAGTSGLKSQWQACPVLWHSWARPCPQWVLPQPPFQM